MIGSLKGEITLKKEKFLILEAGGVGYKINVSSDTLLKSGNIGERLSLFTYTYVREDALELFGFLSYEELEFFEMLISVSGIGPRSALSVLSVTGIETLKKAIGSGDISYLTKVSGIGKKTAEKIVIELRDKIKEGQIDFSLQGDIDALEALKSLGYSQNEARESLKRVTSDGDINTKIREALKILGNK
ncbi:MAG: Holliday junction branch migration protein RuvA [Candidatus Paceibacterota bacterium]|jgi:Holliday junction DNA helicase RuvA